MKLIHKQVWTHTPNWFRITHTESSFSKCHFRQVTNLLIVNTFLRKAPTPQQFCHSDGPFAGQDNFTIVRVYDILVSGHPSLFNSLSLLMISVLSLLRTCCSGFLYSYKPAYGPEERIHNLPISLKEPTPLDVCVAQSKAHLSTFLAASE